MKETPAPRVSLARIEQAQASLIPLICYDFMIGILQSRKPLDKELTAYFRSNKRFGSHDRKLISNSLFSLMRYWGFVRKLSPAHDPEQLAQLTRDKLLDDPRYLRPILAAVLLDGLPCTGVYAIWAKACKINPEDCANWKTLDLESKSQALAAVFHCNAPNILALFPPFFKDELPPEMDVNDLAQWLQKRPPLWLRVQKDVNQAAEALKEAGLLFERHSRLTCAWKISDTRVNLYETRAFRDGYVEVQDIASQCVGHVCDVHPHERWLDYCAGAGGKTLHLSALLQNTGNVTAVDKRNWKLDDLRKRARRAGLQNILVRETQGEFPKVPANSFHGVLVDASCSCTGTWRRNPDARWTLDVSEIEELAVLQRAILDHACKAVRPNGVLVYSTCSLSKHENEETVHFFLEQHPEFELEAFPHPLTGECVESGMLRINPHLADSDCMFMARMRKKEVPHDDKQQE